MTLKEIAKEAGVSVSTVSRVINQENTKAASPEVQARIWEIIRRTGYSPNKTARNLKLGQSAELRDPNPKSIACIYARTHTDMSDPFFSQIVKALELEAIKSRYFIRYSFTSQDLGRPETTAQLTQFPADGIVVLGRYDQRIASLVSNLSKNVVYTGLIPMDFQFDQVVCDGSEIVYTAISYLNPWGIPPSAISVSRIRNPASAATRKPCPNLIFHLPSATPSMSIRHPKAVTKA